MYKKILIGGVTAAAIVGAGGTALAVTGSDTTSGTNTTSATAAHAKTGKGKAHKGNGLLRRIEHGQFVTKGKTGTVTHDVIRGTVTSVSATSITVQAADKVSETFAVTKETKVRVRSDGKGAASTIGTVAKGDTVLVTGTGTPTSTARHIVDVKKK